MVFWFEKLCEEIIGILRCNGILNTEKIWGRNRWLRKFKKTQKKGKMNGLGVIHTRPFGGWRMFGMFQNIPIKQVRV